MPFRSGWKGAESHLVPVAGNEPRYGLVVLAVRRIGASLLWEGCTVASQLAKALYRQRVTDAAWRDHKPSGRWA